MKRSGPLRRKKPMRRAAPRRVTRPGPGSDPAYLEEVRKLPCRVHRSWVDSGFRLCEGDVVAHHAGAKSYDRGSVPLCWKHHGQWHDANGVFKGWDKDLRRTWAEHAIADTQRHLDESMSRD